MLQIKKCFKLFFICHLVLLQVSLVFPKIQPRIVGGTTTNITSTPYLVQLLYDGKFFCGGTLITTRYVLTAAYCIKDVTIQSLSISAGATMLTDAGVRSRVSKVMVPNSYRQTSYNNDVAILKLQTSVEGPGIQPIGLCTTDWQPGATVKVSGWGLTDANDSENDVSTQVRTVNVEVIANSKCAELYRDETSWYNTLFCAAIPGSKDTCYGDTGGPGIINGEICGVVLIGVGCAREAYPGVYTDVSAMRSFIKSAMNE